MRSRMQGRRVRRLGAMLVLLGSAGLVLGLSAGRTAQPVVGQAIGPGGVTAGQAAAPNTRSQGLSPERAIDLARKADARLAQAHSYSMRVETRNGRTVYVVSYGGHHVTLDAGSGALVEKR